ncbi:MAG: hypothetical protein P1U32_04985 [Legionellaceae bacterium]|nr:hypothetical protein [Legionellaceae bacterium]
MWSVFGYHFFSTEEKEILHKGYTTQKAMLEETGIKRGLCQPLSNTWLEGQMDGTGSGYLSDKDETLERALAVNDAQREMRDKGEDYKNYAFVKTETPYQQKEIPVSELTTQAGVKNALSGHQYALFSYQTKGAGPRHAMAFKNGTDAEPKCRFFNADLYGGEASGPCEDVMKLFALTMKHTANLKNQEEVARVTLST